MKKIWLNKAYSFEEAKKFDENYYLTMPETKRLETVQFLRDIFYKLKRDTKHEDRKRLRRVIKVI